MNKEDTINKFNEFTEYINNITNKESDMSYSKYVEMMKFLKETEDNFINENDIINYTKYFISVLEGRCSQHLRKMKIEKINYKNVSTN